METKALRQHDPFKGWDPANPPPTTRERLGDLLRERLRDEDLLAILNAEDIRIRPYGWEVNPTLVITLRRGDDIEDRKEVEREVESVVSMDVALVRP